MGRRGQDLSRLARPARTRGNGPRRPRAIAPSSLVLVLAASLLAGCGGAKGPDLKIFELTGRPSAVAAVDDRVFVADDEANTVTMYSAQTGRPLAKPQKVGAAPVDLSVADGSVWVASALAGSVTSLDVRTGEAGGDLAVCNTPVDVEAAPWNGRVGVACIEGVVAMIDTATRRVVARSPELPDGAARLAWIPRGEEGGGTLWALGTTDQLLPLDVATVQPAGPTIRVDGGPIAMASYPMGLPGLVVAAFDSMVVGLVRPNGAIVESVELESAPQALVVSGSFVWVITRSNQLVPWTGPEPLAPVADPLPFRARGLAPGDGDDEVWVVGVDPPSLARLRY